jgi:hypothetical protein
MDAVAKAQVTGPEIDHMHAQRCVARLSSLFNRAERSQFLRLISARGAGVSSSGIDVHVAVSRG